MNTYKDQFKAWLPGELALSPTEILHATFDRLELNTSLMYMDRDIKRLMILSKQRILK